MTTPNIIITVSNFTVSSSVMPTTFSDWLNSAPNVTTTNVTADNVTARNVTAFSAPELPDSIRTRNLAIGCLGCILNTSCILVLLASRKTKLSLRLTMISLSVNDLCFTADAIFFGVTRWAWVSDEPQCLPVTFIIVATLVVSFLMTGLMALHNYIAVYHPFTCSTILSTPRSLVAIASCWVCGYLVTFAGFGTSIDKGLQCFAVVIMSRWGVMLVCAVCLLSSFLIVAINIKICFLIRKSHKAVHNISEPSASNETADTNINSTENISYKQHANQFNNTRFGSNHKNINANQNLPVNFNGKNTSTKDIFTVYINQRMDARASGIDGPSSSGGKGKNSSVNFKTMAGPTIQSNNLLHVPGRTGTVRQTRISNNTVVVKDGSVDLSPNIKQYSCLQRLKTFCSRPTPLQRQSGTYSIVRQSASRRRARTRNTLVIMTLWSCFLTLPIILQMFYGALWATDRQKFSSSIFGIFVTTLISVHAISNPVLYIWRLVQWRTVYRKVIALIRGSSN